MFAVSSSRSANRDIDLQTFFPMNVFSLSESNNHESTGTNYIYPTTPRVERVIFLLVSFHFLLLVYLCIDLFILFGDRGVFLILFQFPPPHGSILLYVAFLVGIHDRTGYRAFSLSR